MELTEFAVIKKRAEERKGKEIEGNESRIPHRKVLRPHYKREAEAPKK